jgi:hypothetical protein
MAAAHIRTDRSGFNSQLISERRSRMMSAFTPRDVPAQLDAQGQVPERVILQMKKALYWYSAAAADR